jgi:prevent-host-death family protein
MQVKMHAAKSQLSKLVEAAERGEEVILARGNTPVAKIVPIAATPKPFVYGILADVLKGPMPDFEPMSDEELDRLEQEKDERIARSLA